MSSRLVVLGVVDRLSLSAGYFSVCALRSPSAGHRTRQRELVVDKCDTHDFFADEWFKCVVCIWELWESVCHFCR